MAAGTRTAPVVIVTGASSGIGREVAQQFGARGARVALLARRAERLAQVAHAVEVAGGEALALPTDVADQPQVFAAVRAVTDRWGRVDVLVNNAGFGVHGSVEECTPEDFERLIAVNYLGAVYATLAVLPAMQQSGSGSIVFVSSISAVAPSPLSAGYCASKAALHAFAAATRLDLRGTGVSVSVISPGYTETEFDAALVKRRPFRRDARLRPLTASAVARHVVQASEHPRRNDVLPLALRLLVPAVRLFPGAVERWQIRTRDRADQR